jgi:hypothetical protein
MMSDSFMMRSICGWGGPLVVPWLTAWRRVRGVIFARKRRLKIS